MDRRAMLIGLLGATLSVAAVRSSTAGAADRKQMTAADWEKVKPTAGLVLEAAQVGFIVGGGSGKGMLHFKGKNYPFTIKGGTAGTVGATKVNATGDVYFLEKLEDFAGTYGAVSAGGALVKGGGQAQFENDNGVIISLKSKSKGAALNLGVSAVTITLAK